MGFLECRRTFRWSAGPRLPSLPEKAIAFPKVEDIRLFLLIPRPISLPFDAEAVFFIKLAGAQVALKCPETQRIRGFPGQREQSAPKPMALDVGMDIKLIHPAGAEDDEADDHPGYFGEPDLRARENAGRVKIQVFLRGV
jgi:hypothetical protein